MSVDMTELHNQSSAAKNKMTAAIVAAMLAYEGAGFDLPPKGWQLTAASAWAQTHPGTASEESFDPEPDQRSVVSGRSYDPERLNFPEEDQDLSGFDNLNIDE